MAGLPMAGLPMGIQARKNRCAKQCRFPAKGAAFDVHPPHSATAATVPPTVFRLRPARARAGRARAVPVPPGAWACACRGAGVGETVATGRCCAARRGGGIGARRHQLRTPVCVAMPAPAGHARPAHRGADACRSRPRRLARDCLDQLRFRPARAGCRGGAGGLAGTALADDIADRRRRTIIGPRDAGKRLSRLVSGHDTAASPIAGFSLFYSIFPLPSKTLSLPSLQLALGPLADGIASARTSPRRLRSQET